MKASYLHSQPYLLLLLVCVALPVSSATPFSQSDISNSECMITRKLLTSNVVLPLNYRLNSDMSFTFSYEITRSLGLYSHCYNLQIEFITKESIFKATNIARSDTNNQDASSPNLNFALTEKFFTFSVTVPEESISSSCPKFRDGMNDFIFYCKIKISLIEVSSQQSVGYFENEQLVFALLPTSELYEQYWSYFRSLPGYYHKMTFSPEITNQNVGLKKFTTLNDVNFKKNSDQRNQLDLSSGSSLDGDNAIQVKERIVNQDAEEQIGYELYTYPKSDANQTNQNQSVQEQSNSLLVEDAKIYHQQDIQYQQFSATSTLELFLPNYPTNLIFSVKLGSTYCQFAQDNQKNKKFTYYYSNSSDCSVSAQSRDSNNGRYSLYFDHPADQDNITVIQEVVFYTAQKNINKVFVSQFFQLQRTRNTLQISSLQTELAMNLLLNSNNQQPKQETNIFLSHLSLNDNLFRIVVAAFLVLLVGCFVILFIYKRRKSALNQTNSSCSQPASGKTLLEANAQDLEA